MHAHAFLSFTDLAFNLLDSTTISVHHGLPGIVMARALRCLWIIESTFVCLVQPRSRCSSHGGELAGRYFEAEQRDDAGAARQLARLARDV